LYDHRYVIEDDGELHCHWDPVIPFADASLVQQFDINLLSTSRLYWSDALMSGRTSRGERWRFRDVAHRLRLTVDGSLTYLERFTLAAADRDVMHPWMASQADYLGTTIVYHTQATADIADALQRELDAGSAVAGVDLTAPRLLVARLLASRGPSFATARDVLRRSVLARIFHTPQLIGRK
jgi:urease accessory protein UreH